MNRGTIGKWTSIIGLVLAVLAGLFFQPVWAIWVLGSLLSVSTPLWLFSNCTRSAT